MSSKLRRPMSAEEAERRRLIYNKRAREWRATLAATEETPKAAIVRLERNKRARERRIAAAAERTPEENEARLLHTRRLQRRRLAALRNRRKTAEELNGRETSSSEPVGTVTDWVVDRQRSIMDRVRSDREAALRKLERRLKLANYTAWQRALLKAATVDSLPRNGEFHRATVIVCPDRAYDTTPYRLASLYEAACLYHESRQIRPFGVRRYSRVGTREYRRRKDDKERLARDYGDTVESRGLVDVTVVYSGSPWVDRERNYRRFADLVLESKCTVIFARQTFPFWVRDAFDRRVPVRVWRLNLDSRRPRFREYSQDEVEFESHLEALKQSYYVDRFERVRVEIAGNYERPNLLSRAPLPPPVPTINIAAVDEYDSVNDESPAAITDVGVELKSTYDEEDLLVGDREPSTPARTPLPDNFFYSP